VPSPTPTLPWRGPGPGRPDLPTPPARMPLLRGGRQRKRWRYVAAFGPELMLCAASVEIGVGRQSFWGVWDRVRGHLHEHTVWARGGVRLGDGFLTVRDGGVEIDLAWKETPGIESVCAAGRAYTWTRKQGGVPATGEVVLDGERRTLAMTRMVIDDSAGYHDRHTEWRWSAGVGDAVDSRPVAWNLVAGINDPPVHSERTVWVDGEPFEPGPVAFAHDLSSVAFAEDGALRFAAESERARADNLLLVRSRYRQPFGTFSGVLPGGVALRDAWGVMEHHVAVW
jgi:hypothetical protein